MFSWIDVCKPKSHDGLGFKIILVWNAAMVDKQAWSIAMKSDNLWVNWVHYVYIKDNLWSNYEAPQSSSWALKYICKAKNEISMKLGVGWLGTHTYSTDAIYKQLDDHLVKMDGCV